MPVNLLKLQKDLPEGWTEEADTMTEAQLRDVIVEATNNMKVAKEELEKNKAYQKAKLAWQDASGPVKDAERHQKAKVAYCLEVLSSKGKI